MFIANDSVKISLVPSAISPSRHCILLKDHSAFVANGRTRAVFDCSQVLEMTHGIWIFLLCCLEESMMTNGDVRLAGLSPSAQAALAKSGIGQLFQQFDTVELAVASFSRVSRMRAVGLDVPNKGPASVQLAA